MELFDVELADAEIEAAETTLGLLTTHDAASPYVIAREVQWRAARAEGGDRAAARAAIERLCLTDDGEAEWPFRAAADALTNVGWGKDADIVYTEAMERPDVAPVLGMVWAERWAARRDWRQARKLRPLLAGGGEAARRALDAYVLALRATGAGWRLRLCIRRHRAALRERARSWGLVGFALLGVGRRRAVVRWLADWPERDGLEPWMLVNLVISLRGLGRDEEAARVSLRGVELPTDHGKPDHHLWLALDDLLDGRVDEASGRLDGLNRSTFDGTNRYLYDLAQILRDAERAEPDARRRTAILARRDVKALSRNSVVESADYPAVVRLFRRAVRRLADHVGPWRGRVSLLELHPPSRA